MKQNYILVMCDDLGYGDVSFNGNKIIHTPYLDRLAKEGAVFKNFYSGAPVCSPTRGTCLTGRHHYRYTVTSANEGALPKEEITIAQMLKAQGYATGHFGKWHLGTLSKTIPDGRRGGAKNLKAYSPPWEHHIDECFSTEVAVPLYNPMENQPFVSKYWTAEDEYATENLEGDDSKIIMDRAIPFIEKNAEANTPFFAIIWFHAPHKPVVASPEHRSLYAQYPPLMQHYFGSITAMDEQVGRLNAKIKALGLEENTCIWFCSDNGPEGESVKDGGDGVGTTAGLRGRKRSLFNGGINVPACIKWPAYVEAGSTYSFLASTLDFLPTFFAHNAIEMPDSRPIDGANLLEHFVGAESKRLKPIPIRLAGHSKAKMAGSPTFGLINDDYKILCNFNEEHPENMMFNTFADKREEFNIAETHADIFEKYKAELWEMAQSFERSHLGEDYGVANYEPKFKFKSHDTTWHKME
ncbi:sulfatase [Candidatus Epulonipiscium viviparus]|uniref:sulfatase family protein n=1 Tax=Candidatus Epulonipiscium viviparus TaxID=420336 RepID=UPI0027380B93|nr:sulfatase-like hydrolase/transferase [Candidatus Epulopiscium viviparus]